MSRFIAARIVGAAGVLLTLITVVFLLQSVIPGDPARVRVGANASAAVVARERHVLGLDRPLPAQFVSYLSGVLRGSLGQSVHTGRPVLSDIGTYLPATIELAAAAMALAIIGGLLLGLLTSAAARGADGIRLLLIAGASAPTFLLGLIFIYVFYLKLGWLPASGQASSGTQAGPTGVLVLDGIVTGQFGVVLDALRHLILPAVTLALLPAVAIGRVLRSSLLDVYHTDFIRTARSKGLSPGIVLWRHALRNALSAPLTMTGLQFGLMLGGVVVVETVFSWPGIGLYVDQSIQAGDLIAITGVTLVVGVGYVVVNALVDLAQAIADPRIRL
jgi:peptide/nickel transport system permease protein